MKKQEAGGIFAVFLVEANLSLAMLHLKPGPAMTLEYPEMKGLRYSYSTSQAFVVEGAEPSITQSGLS